MLGSPAAAAGGCMSWSIGVDSWWLVGLGESIDMGEGESDDSADASAGGAGAAAAAAAAVEESDDCGTRGAPSESSEGPFCWVAKLGTSLFD